MGGSREENYEPVFKLSLPTYTLFSDSCGVHDELKYFDSKSKREHKHVSYIVSFSIERIN